MSRSGQNNIGKNFLFTIEFSIFVLFKIKKMGTRNSTLIQIDGEYKVAQYCQWDGYPEGVGSALLSLLKEVDLGLLKQKIKNLSSLSQEEIREKWKERGSDGSGWVSLEVSDKFKKKYPHLHRDCSGAELLSLVSQDVVKEVSLNVDFPKDSLFCEWCYVIDFDKGTFEIYKGFNKEKLSEEERFYSEPDPEASYQPVKLLRECKLEDLPRTEEFLSEIEAEVEKIIQKDEEELNSFDPEL